ncbi:MAG: DivIVA domain-containing protein [Candidatus Cloacimonetes bacterium]|nr:DivIVA domain-containing protein [Candidatus Cloacimonadota bacterium]
MGLKPEDIKYKEFKTSLMGYSKDEVRAYLEEIALEFKDRQSDWEKKSEEAALQTKATKQEIESATSTVSDLKKREQLITRTLVLAEKTKAEIVENARKEGDLIIKEAQIKAQNAIQQARQYLNVYEHQFVALKEQKRQFLMRMKAELNTFVDQIENDPLLNRKSEQLMDKEFKAIQGYTDQKPGQEQKDKK